MFTTVKISNLIDLMVFENRMLRRMFGPKTEEVAGKWRKFHNEEGHNLYSEPSVEG
jgi:hypothetical protein